MALYDLKMSNYAFNNYAFDIIDKRCVVNFILGKVKLFGDKYKCRCNNCIYNNSDSGFCLKDKYKWLN